jgi:hypothetical protein
MASSTERRSGERGRYFGIGQSAAAGTTEGTININSGTVVANSTNGIRFGATTGSTPGGTVNLNAGDYSAS